MRRAAGSSLPIATGAIHLDPYLTGCRATPMIGRLFLPRVIAAFGLGRAVFSREAAMLTREAELISKP